MIFIIPTFLPSFAKVAFPKENKSEEICKWKPIQRKVSVHMRTSKLFEVYKNAYTKIYTFVEPCSFHVTRSLGHMVLQSHVTYYIRYISTTARPVAIKLGKVVSYYNGLQGIKSHNSLNTCSTLLNATKVSNAVT